MGTCIGFLGAGNMGAAIIKGLAGIPDVTALAYDVNPAKVAVLAGENLARAAASTKELAAGQRLSAAVRQAPST